MSKVKADKLYSAALHSSKDSCRCQFYIYIHPLVVVFLCIEEKTLVWPSQQCINCCIDTVRSAPAAYGRSMSTDLVKNETYPAYQVCITWRESETTQVFSLSRDLASEKCLRMLAKCEAKCLPLPLIGSGKVTHARRLT